MFGFYRKLRSPVKEKRRLGGNCLLAASERGGQTLMAIFPRRFNKFSYYQLKLILVFYSGDPQNLKLDFSFQLTRYDCTS